MHRNENTRPEVTIELSTHAEKLRVSIRPAPDRHFINHLDTVDPEEQVPGNRFSAFSNSCNRRAFTPKQLSFETFSGSNSIQSNEAIDRISKSINAIMRYCIRFMTYSRAWPTSWLRDELLSGHWPDSYFAARYHSRHLSLICRIFTNIYVVICMGILASDFFEFLFVGPALILSVHPYHQQKDILHS